MKYSVDKIENDIVVLENIKDNNITEINIKDLPFKVYENDILVFDGKDYTKDDLEKQKRILRIKDKMKKLRK